MTGQIRDKFPKKKKKVTVKLEEELYLTVIENLKKSGHTFSEFIEASMLAFLEEIKSDKIK